MEIVLTIAGSDPSAGAGIQQDLKVITALGGYAATVIAGMTAQNTCGVRLTSPVDPVMLEAQLAAVFDDLEVAAVKTGMLSDARSVQLVVDAIARWRQMRLDKGLAAPVVCDPIMVSTSGRALLDPLAVSVMKSRLFPLCTLVTPNLPEAEHLVGYALDSEELLNRAGRELVSLYGAAFLLKGGHAQGNLMTDRLYSSEECWTYTEERVVTSNLHGTGCTLSSAVATYLAQGQPLPTAVGAAKRFIHDAILRSRDWQVGRGNGPLNVFQ